MTLFGATIPFADHCGIEEIGVEDGRTRLRMVLRPEHANNFGIVHGGAICTLLDVAMGTAGRVRAGVPVMTLDMHASFIAAGKGTLIGEGRVLRAGRSVIFCEAEVREEDGGRLIAASSGTFMPVRDKAGAG